MITLNGKKFARNNREFAESLFSPGGTCVGYYKVLKRAVILMDMRGERIGCVNWDGVLASATRGYDGRYRYCYRNPDLIGEFPRYLDKVEACQAIVKEHIKERCPR
jgi:hypothetical protein